MGASRMDAGRAGRFLLIAAAQMAVFSAASAKSWGQCAAGWIPNGLPGTNGTVKALIVWDPDGPGPFSPQLIVGGHFTMLGNTAVNNIAAYDLQTGAISNLGGGVTGQLLFGPIIYDLAIDTDNNVVVTGDFRSAGGMLVYGIARWDGSAWSAYGGGTGLNHAVAVLPNGDVVAAGESNYPVSTILRWDGQSWTNFGNYLGGEAFSIIARPNGDVVTGGNLGVPGSPHIVSGDGVTWYGLGSGMDSQGVEAFALLSNGDLIVAGSINAIQALGVARWDGFNWYSIGSGPNILALTLTVTRDSSIVAAGNGGVRLWDGQTWNVLAPGGTGVVYGSTLLPSGDLAVGGDFTNIGGVAAGRLARYRFASSRADLNCDGLVNNFDIDPFVLALTDAAGYATAYPACNRRNADTNCDGMINDFDIDPFVLCLVGHCP